MMVEKKADTKFVVPTFDQIWPSLFYELYNMLIHCLSIKITLLLDLFFDFGLKSAKIKCNF